MSFAGPNPLGATGSYTLANRDPTGKSKVVSRSVTLTPTNGAQVIDLTGLPDGSQIGAIVSVYIDASNAPVPVTVQFADTGAMIEVPAYSQVTSAALTAGTVMTVAAPLIGVLGQNVPVVIQAANFALPPSVGAPVLPNANAGALATIGNAAGWTTFDGTIPLMAAAGNANAAPAGALYTSLELDSTGFGGQLDVSGTDITGAAWAVSNLPLQKSEFVVPATQAGAPFTAAATIPKGGNTTALIPSRWRVQAVGEGVSYNVPLYLPWLPFSFTAMAAGVTNQVAFAAVAGSGVYLDKISVTANGWSSALSVSLIDGAQVNPIFDATFPSGNVVFSEDLGYVSAARGTALTIAINNLTGAATGALVVSVRGSYVAASQNG